MYSCSNADILTKLYINSHVTLIHIRFKFHEVSDNCLHSYGKFYGISIDSRAVTHAILKLV